MNDIEKINDELKTLINIMKIKVREKISFEYQAENDSNFKAIVGYFLGIYQSDINPWIEISNSNIEHLERKNIKRYFATKIKISSLQRSDAKVSK